MKTKLSNGTTGFFREDGTWQCTGSRMGRRDCIPDADAAPKLHLTRLKWVDGDYDEGGAYWGRGQTDVYRAEGEAEGVDERYEVFVRATSRQGAKVQILGMIPAARFFR